MAEKKQQASRRKRADGELSRERILDAATVIAAERGYEGTSIGLVSKSCGLPASSIYWHFTDKDDLIAAVIERSFGAWFAAWQLPEHGNAEERFRALAVATAKAYLDSPDFIRLGLMLALERRPVEARGRTMFIRVRAQAFAQLLAYLSDVMPELSEADAQRMAEYTVAGADGLFIAKEIGGDAVDLIALFEVHGRSMYDIARRMIADNKEKR
ncbi:MAG TPA: TetR/AcrR family transcriptional regulator [Mycobacterium sp.]|nr:TetR/AcrR family transcriptional regulator [Mycobacterium sp.]